MALNIRRLRIWFASAIIVLLLVVAGFYWYGRLRVRHLVRELPKTSLGVDVQQSTQGFSLSKSEGGRTLFTIHAARAVQFAGGGHAELQDVNIIAYGRQSDRYDQIYGADFSYDAQSGNATAKGIVHIDLEANAEGPVQPDQAPPRELKNPIHLKTSDLVFNQKTGMAHTNERIEFRIPQMSGAAIGATYDSRANTLLLHDKVIMRSSGADAATLDAQYAVITKDPTPRVQLEHARLLHRGSTMDADRLTVLLRPGNTVEHIIAAGNVTATTTGKTKAHASAPRGDLYLDAKNRPQSAQLSGGVSFEASGERAMQGSADRVQMTFGADSRVDKIRAINDVKLVQQPLPSQPQEQSMQLSADAVDFFTDHGRGLKRAETSGAAQITFGAPPGRTNTAGRTTVTAGRFLAAFGGKGRLQTVVGEPHAKLVSSTPGQPDKTATSATMKVTMNPLGGPARIVQQGNFHYFEPARVGEAAGGGREAWGETATFRPDGELFVLSGSPRVRDGSVVTTANVVRLNRRTGEAFAEGDVKTTYSELKPQPGGALLATSDPIHVTAAAMAAQRSPAVAQYSGGARLWQGVNIVEAPVIDFDRDRRTVTARSLNGQRVSTVFAEYGENGRETPVNVTAGHLSYADAQRRARFDGGVVVRGAQGTVTAELVDVFLDPRGQSQPSSLTAGASQLNRIVAQRHVVVQQPNRRASGENLIYTAADGRFRLTGGPPSIFDAERGKITGDSLTFFSRDDRVLVEGASTSPSVTKARVIK